MTRAVQQGRNLALYVDGLEDDPIIVQPLAAKRGRALTEAFVTIAFNGVQSEAVSEAVFIEAINPMNFASIAGGYVDEFDAAGRYVTTWSPVGSMRHEQLADAVGPARYIGREASADLDEVDVEGMPIRQAEAESLSLCAFYWQTVVGIEAVQAFIDGGEGTAGSLKALNLLLMRIGRSPSPSSLQAVTESLTQQDDSEGTPATESSSSSVPLPANRRGFLPARNPRKAAKPRRR